MPVNRLKYDAKAQRQITRDWEREFALLQFWKPKRLLKRHGPLLVGICLDRDSSGDNYTPMAHFHVLCIPFPTISLSLCGEVLYRGVPRHIKVKNHQAEFHEAAAALKAEQRYLNSTSLKFNDFLEATAAYFNSRKTGYSAKGMFNSLQDVVAVAAWMGRLDYAQQALDYFYNESIGWDERYLNIVGSRESWRDKVQAWIDDPQILRDNVEEQITTHKLDAIKDHGIVWSEPPLEIKV